MAAAVVVVAKNKAKERDAAAAAAAADGVEMPAVPIPRKPRIIEKEFLPMQHKVKALYQASWCQLTVAVFIVGNFIITCLEKEIDPRASMAASVWEPLDLFFNIIFLIEILVNMYGCGGPFKRFWTNPWNVFDFIVVAVGVLFMLNLVSPESPLSNLKMLRAFRVFRLFKRIKSLNKIIVALVRSLPGVFNAFIIMVIFMMIYAILAVEYFSMLGTEHGAYPRGTYMTFGDNGENHTISAETARGFDYGWEYYGTWSRAMYTLFQVMTGESWSEAVARPLLFGLYEGSALVTMYFVSFILLMQIVLTNVVVAVLLDKFVQEPEAEEEEEEGEEPAPPSAAVVSSVVTGGDSAYAVPDSPVAVPKAGSAAAPLATPADSMDAKLDLLLSEIASLKREVASLKAER